MDQPETQEPSFVSRGGLKLDAALTAFGVNPDGAWCVDLGCSTGGFTDCLLQAGAGRVYSVDTAYGEFAWKLRQHERVRVMERTNALHAEIPPEVMSRGGVELAVIDLGWTTQAKAIPAARQWVRPGGRIITLVKPHYEASALRTADERAEATKRADRRPSKRRGQGAGAKPSSVLSLEDAQRVTEMTLAALRDDGYGVEGTLLSPILGGKRSGTKRGKGNREWLVLLRVPGEDIHARDGEADDAAP
ncbi:MAG: SAM-dependent methyltransferase [Planctomycetota bacterium]